METAALEKEGGAREERFIARREGGWKGRETELGRYRGMGQERAGGTRKWEHGQADSRSVRGKA